MKKLIYLGPEGSYTQLAAKKISPDVEFEAQSSIKKIIEIMDNLPPNLQNEVEAVIPIENFIQGIVRETIDNLVVSQNIQIIKEVILPISHCLVTNEDNPINIKKVYSHPQALAQCNGFLVNNLPQAEILPTTSTSEAVRLIKNSTQCAAIASMDAASFYGMPVLLEKINDEPDNKTRFILIGHRQLPPSGDDRTGFAFSTLNRAGALVDVMSIFKKYNINLSYIDSRPSKKVFGTYTFYIECDAYIEDDMLQQSIKEIMPLTTFLKFVGSYPKDIL